MAPCFWVMPNFPVACSFEGGAMLCALDEEVWKFGLMENNLVGWELVNFMDVFFSHVFWKEVVWRFFQDAGWSRECLGCWNLLRVGELVQIVWNWSSVPSHHSLSESLICAWDHCDCGKAKSRVIRHKTSPFQSCFWLSTPFSLEILHLVLPYPKQRSVNNRTFLLGLIIVRAVPHIPTPRNRLGEWGS